MVLAQEFDENHLTDMMDLANIQDDLWHQICAGNEEEGSSYLDQYPGSTVNPLLSLSPPIHPSFVSFFCLFKF